VLLAHAFLIVAAVAPAGTNPPALSEEDRRAADHYVKEGHAWTQELTSLGENLGNMLMNVVDGKQNGEATRAEIKRVAALGAIRVAHFKATPSPGFPEMVAYRALFLDYLAWEQRSFRPMMNEALKIAEDKKRTRSEKGPAILASVRAYDRDEQVWKAKFEPVIKAVYAAINRK